MWMNHHLFQIDYAFALTKTTNLNAFDIFLLPQHLVHTTSGMSNFGSSVLFLLILLISKTFNVTFFVPVITCSNIQESFFSKAWCCQDVFSRTSCIRWFNFRITTIRNELKFETIFIEFYRCIVCMQHFSSFKKANEFSFQLNSW